MNIPHHTKLDQIKRGVGELTDEDLKLNQRARPKDPHEKLRNELAEKLAQLIKAMPDEGGWQGPGAPVDWRVLNEARQFLKDQTKETK